MMDEQNKRFKQNQIYMLTDAVSIRMSWWFRTENTP